MDVTQPTLDHLRVFLEVARQGSFNRAAKSLGRAISVVSYAIATLEGQLGVTLFEREGSRRPQLTEAGTALLADAQAVVGDVDALVARVRGLQQGLEAELAVTMDVMVPSRTLAQMLADYRREFPTVPLRLHVEALGAVAALVLERRATFGIAGPDIVEHRDLELQSVGSVELVPVAAPQHPLARMEAIPPGEVRKHLQLVLTDRSALTEGREFSVFSPNTWRLADLGAKHALIKEGIGWGNMPRHLIAEDFERGTLCELTVPEIPGTAYRLHAVWRRDTPPGPAACWMMEEMRQRLS